MPALKTAGAPTFDEIEITAFLKIIDKIFATYDITGDQEKKQ
tara:strand:- start:831 stop:956 length:126 start_codon:yes stop_codon:yes gene_type:complete